MVRKLNNSYKLSCMNQCSAGFFLLFFTLAFWGPAAAPWASSPHGRLFAETSLGLFASQSGRVTFYCFYTIKPGQEGLKTKPRRGRGAQRSLFGKWKQPELSKFPSPDGKTYIQSSRRVFKDTHLSMCKFLWISTGSGLSPPSAFFVFIDINTHTFQ